MGMGMGMGMAGIDHRRGLVIWWVIFEWSYVILVRREGGGEIWIWICSECAVHVRYVWMTSYLHVIRGGKGEFDSRDPGNLGRQMVTVQLPVSISMSMWMSVSVRNREDIGTVCGLRVKLWKGSFIALMGAWVWIQNYSLLPVWSENVWPCVPVIYRWNEGNETDDWGLMGYRSFGVMTCMSSYQFPCSCQCRCRCRCRYWSRRS